MTAQRNSLPGQATSLWLDTTPGTDLPPLQEGLSVDVAVIGGGLAGLTTAALLKAEGRRVAVLEARRIVHGVTGYTTAKLTSQHGLIYDHLLRHQGEEKARAYAEANEAAVELVDRLARQLGIDCDFLRTEAYTCVHAPEDVERAEAEVEAARKLGLPATLVHETPLPFRVAAAVRFDQQARFHPRKYLLALADRIPGDGSYLFEETRVTDVQEGDPCTVQTSRGEIRAADVVVATHYPVIDQGFFYARLAPYRSYVLALRLDGPVPPGMYLSEEPFYSLRSHPGPDGELLLAGGGKHKVGQEDDTVGRYEELEAWARDRFPVRSVEYRWSTQDNWTLDRVPYIGRQTPRSEHLYVATGFGGWGMTGSTAAGMLLRDLLVGRPNAWAELYDPNRFNLESLATGARENANVAGQLVGGHLARGAEPEPAPGEGAVVETDQGKVALYRSDDGSVCRLSPNCTHMGCVVRWNQAERSWDCPCHGSRFAADGTVIHGPANQDLERL